MDTFGWIEIGIKVAALVVIMPTLVLVMEWVERRGAAMIQMRPGPNRVGPWGLLQPVADGIKFLWKEDVIPGHVEKFYYVLAPAIPLIPAFMTFAVVPFAGDVTLGDRLIRMQVADLNVGILFILSISSLGVYGIIMAGWSSNNKYSLMGALRSSAQMISYEIALGLSIVGVVLVYGSVHLGQIVEAQAQPFIWGLPKWGIFVQPIGCIIFITAMLAETNRLPFDLPEGENELVGGYHTEYGSMKFALFMLAEYMNMTTASALMATLFAGGYNLLPGLHLLGGALTSGIAQLNLVSNPQDWARVVLQLVSFSAKVGFFLWFFVWIRWTIPRFRYDQLMRLGWTVLLPLALLNIAVTAVLMYLGVV